LDTFKAQGYRPAEPFTEEQAAYCEDLLTSAIMFLELERHDLERLKKKLLRELETIRGMRNHAKNTTGTIPQR